MEWITTAMEYGTPVAELVGWLAVLATVFVRLPFFNMDTTKADGIVGWIMKTLSWLPTIGVNPSTKKMQEAIDGQKK